MNFAESNRIGAGSFGTVYRGKLADGREVAIKRVGVGVTKKFQEKETAFQLELVFLSRLHHKHLVSLIGYCEEGDEQMEKLMASSCWRLKSIRMFEELTELRELGVSECFDLEELPGIELLRSLEKLMASGYWRLKSIRMFEELTEHTDVQGADVRGVGHLRSLEKLMASGCWRLKSIWMFEELTEHTDVRGADVRVLDICGHWRS